ncbi:MAG: sigma-70 family RNA polymerase sigma factor [Chitinophagaceae bacterium]|nr:sigma-70 family RNA polymerase sigma factor [Chitinophagaceae bacterium]
MSGAAYNDSTESVLIERVSIGDEHAFRLLFDRYRDNIYTTIYRITLLDWMAEEILLDCFIKVWTKREELPSVTNFGGWLYTMASRLALNAIQDAARQRSRQLASATLLSEDHVPSGESLLDAKQYQAIVRKAVCALSDHQRETWELIREQGMKRTEVADHLKISPETVKYHFELALKNVRAFCLAYLEGHSGIAVFLLLKIFL